MLKWILGAVLAAGATAASAQSAAQDVRCLVAGNIFSKAEKDPAKRQVASVATFFYLGRVDARMSGAELKAALAAQAKSVTAQSVGPLMTSCVKSMQGKMAVLQAVSQQVAKDAGAK